MDTARLNKHIQDLLASLKKPFQRRSIGIRGVLLILYLFLILSIEKFVTWESGTPELLISLGLILAVVVLVCPIIFCKVSQLKLQLQPKEMSRRESIVWISAFFLVSLGILLCWYLSFYPGAFSTDAFYQYKQALSGKYNDWKPILQTLITFTLPMKLTGKPEAIVLFQIIEFSGALAYMSYVILKYSNRITAIVILSYILLNPVTGNMLIHPWKDVTFAIFAVLLMTFGFQIYVTNGAWVNSKKSVVLLGIALTAATIVRHNGFFFTVPFLIAVFLNVNKKRFLQVLLVFLLCTGAVKGPINYSLEVYEHWNHSTRVLGLPMTVLGNIVNEAPEAFDDATEEFVFSVASKEDWGSFYSCGNFEYLKWNCNQEAIEEAGARKIVWMTAKASLKAPVPALKALLSLTDMVYTINGGLDWDIQPTMAENDYGLELQNLYKSAELVDYTYFSKTGIIKYLPLIKDLSFLESLSFIESLSFVKYLFWYVGVINLIVIGSLLCKCRFRAKTDRRKMAFALPLLCYNGGTMLLLSYSCFKYFYYSFPICGIVILILFGEIGEPQKSSGNQPKRFPIRAMMKHVSGAIKKAIACVRSDWPVAVFALILSGTIIVGGKLRWQSPPYVRPFFAADLIWLGGYWTLLFFVRRALIKAVSQRLTEIQTARAQKKWWIGTFLLLVLLWTPYLLAYYPGILTADSFTSMLQVRDLSRLSNHVPIAYTLMITLFARCGWSVGDTNFGVALFSFAQLVVMAAILSYSVYWIRTRISRNKLVSVGLSLFYGLNPIIALYSITMWKDVLFSGWVVLLCLLLGDIAISDGKELTEKKGIARLCALFSLVAFGRNNGIYVVILTWIIVFLLYKRSRKQVLTICGGVILLILSIQGPGYQKLGIDQAGFAESVGIPLQQVSYTVVHDQNFEKEDLEFLEEIIPIETVKECYSPISVDDIKFNSEFNTNFFEAHKKEFVKLYLKWLPTHFPSYVQAYLLSTRGFWHMTPGSLRWIAADKVDDNDLGIYGLDVLSSRFGLHLKQDMFKAMESVGRLPFTDVGVMVWLVFFYVLISMKQKQRWKILLIVPILACWLTIMIATPVADQFRYLYYYYLMLPIVCIFMFVKKSQAVGTETQGSEKAGQYK